MLTRIISCWRTNTPYEIRNLDGTPLTVAQGRAIQAASVSTTRARRSNSVVAVFRERVGIGTEQLIDVEATFD
jgi:hypothetical protein